MFNNQYYPRYIQPGMMPMQQPIQPVQPMQEAFNSVQQRSIIQGKQVGSEEEARASELLLDGSTSYYPLTDGSKIITKQLQMDGTSKITIYKPVETPKVESKQITHEDIQKAVSEANKEELQAIREDIQEIRNEIKELRKKNKNE